MGVLVSDALFLVKSPVVFPYKGHLAQNLMSDFLIITTQKLKKVLGMTEMSELFCIVNFLVISRVVSRYMTFNNL